MRIVIGVPNTGTLRERTVLSLVGLMRTPGVDVALATQQGAVLHENRWRLVQMARRVHADFLFFLDADIACADTTIARLLAHEKPIVGAAYLARQQDRRESTVSLLPDGKTPGPIPTEPFEAYAVPLGCTLIALEVFEKVPQPWFAYEYSEDGNVSVSEDTRFCREARRAGFPVWCDPTIPVGHVGDYVYR